MTERKETRGLVLAGGGGFGFDEARERHGELPHDGDASRKRFRAPQGGTGKRHQPDGIARGRLGHEWNVYRRLADLSFLSRLFLKNRILFYQRGLYGPDSF